MLKDKFAYVKNVIMRQAPWHYRFIKTNRITSREIKIVGLIRERNESLVLQDTLDHISQFVDGVIVYDDDSSDDSAKIAKNHPIVLEVIINKKWRQDKRIWEETANRRLLHNRGRKLNPDWFFYFDADERFEGEIKHYLTKDCPENINCIRISLFDAYITKDDKKPYLGDSTKLFGFRKFFGPERRDILMIWRNIEKASFIGLDARQPKGFSRKETEVKFYCQHYGKSLSIEQWEETCDYYANFFPKYSEKWLARKGKAVHIMSDFGNTLHNWNKVKERSINMEDI